MSSLGLRKPSLTKAHRATGAQSKLEALKFILGLLTPVTADVKTGVHIEPMKIENLLDYQTILTNQARPVHFALRFEAGDVHKA